MFYKLEASIQLLPRPRTTTKNNNDVLYMLSRNYAGNLSDASPCYCVEIHTSTSMMQRRIFCIYMYSCTQMHITCDLPAHAIHCTNRAHRNSHRGAHRRKKSTK